MFEINGKNYELKYNLKRIEMIENATGVPVMADISKNRGLLSIASLKTYVAYGLKDQDTDTYVKIKEGIEMADSLISSKEAGYSIVDGAVMEALERDCPFFFQNA